MSSISLSSSAAIREDGKGVLALYSPLNLPTSSSGFASLFRGAEAKSEDGGKDNWTGPSILPMGSALALKAISRSVYKPGKVFRMRLTRNAVVTTSGAGVLQIATNITPANMSEYSAVSALFLECRLMSTRITYAMYATGNSPTTTIGVCIAFDPSNQSSAPTFTYACQQPGAKLFNTNSGAFLHCKNSWRGDGKRPWSYTVASSAGTDPVGGSIGTWYTSLSGTTTASQNLGTYLIECDYELRNPL